MNPPDNKDHGTTLTTAYTEVCRSYDRIEDFRAKLLGFLPLVSGAGLFVLLRRPDTIMGDRDSLKLLVPAGTFGFVATFGLLFYELRGIQRCIRLTTVGKALEGQMKIEGWFRRWPHSALRFINEPLAAAFIYPGVLAAWVFLAIIAASPIAAAICAILVLCGGFVFVWKFYKVITRDEEWQRLADDVWLMYSGEPAEKVRSEIMSRLPSQRPPDEMIACMAHAVANKQHFEILPHRRGHILPPSPSTEQNNPKTGGTTRHQTSSSSSLHDAGRRIRLWSRRTEGNH